MKMPDMRLARCGADREQVKEPVLRPLLSAVLSLSKGPSKRRPERRPELVEGPVEGGSPKDQILAGLEEIEADIRHVQRLVVEDAPCCEVLRATAGVQIVLSRLERALLLCELRECLLQLCDCTPEASPALLEEIVEIFSTVESLPVRNYAAPW